MSNVDVLEMDVPEQETATTESASTLNEASESSERESSTDGYDNGHHNGSGNGHVGDARRSVIPPKLVAAQSAYKHSPETDPFYYGWRNIIETLPDGTETYYQIPLTQADFLDPQLGDEFVQSAKHNALVLTLYAKYDTHYRYEDTVGIYSDVKMLWRIPKLKEPSPDLAIVPNIKDKLKQRSSFDTVAEKTKPIMVIEVVSPNYPGDDTDKVKIYQQAGVQEYFIIDPNFERDEKEMTITGYRLVNDVYEKIMPDEQGRLLSSTTNTLIELMQDEQDVSIIDVGKNYVYRHHTDTPMIDEAIAQAEAERQRAEAERQRADDLEAQLAALMAQLEQQRQ
ncbi:MAG: Uma2 family endonuclease [Chloroflexota bacterium]